MLLVILVCFVVVMMVWFLGLLGHVPAPASSWMPFIACLLLGLAVFVAWGPSSVLR